MARVTVEDCLARIPNRFALTILASRRARALSEGRGRALIECDNKEGVTALREVSADKVRYKEDVEGTMRDFIEEQRRQLRVTTGEHTFLEAASFRALDDEEEVEEEEVEEIEELQSDPEALNKQAKGEIVEGVEEEEEEEEEAEEEFEEGAETFDEDIPEEEGEPPPDLDEEEAAPEEEEEEPEPEED